MLVSNLATDQRLFVNRYCCRFLFAVLSQVYFLRRAGSQMALKDGCFTGLPAPPIITAKQFRHIATALDRRKRACGAGSKRACIAC